MARAGQDEMRRKLGLRTHAPGTPTPSAPGTPPAHVSGRLGSSVLTSGPYGGGGVWTAYSGPHGVVYAAIQNFGGVAGRGHKTHLPPRPYTLKPSDRDPISRAGSDAFHRAMGV
jgi:phage gpG-like protein